MVAQKNEPIAIIGSSCRFPGGSSSPSKLWELLREPQDVLSQIPPTRFSAQGFYHPDGLHHGNSNVQHAYILSEDPRHFDAKFFGFKGVEASATDPQQRILLEIVYEGVEAAGIPMNSLQGSDTAVYVGLMCGDYEAMLLRDLDTIPTYHATGTARSIMANRISYFFDWHGPSMIIDTACSSSLVAVHQAVQSLRSGESRVAVAAGSNLILGPENYISESNLKMLSPTGRSRMWDKNADGYARGEGVAAIVLKTLSAALRDGDQIECLIRETAVNQDGRTRGITMPSASAQASLIRQTYAKAGLDPRKFSDRCHFFEAHGTGTPTGDPLEAEAISSAFFAENEAQSSDLLYVGSIKSVIGHTEGTAGLAGVLKASLALQHSVLPPNLLFNELATSVKPYYDNLRILSKSQPWPCLPAGQPRRASVNSFGFGGTNAHAILESYEPVLADKTEDSRAVFMPFTFSANSEASLATQLRMYHTYLSRNPSVSLHDLAFTLNRRRTMLPIKAAFAAQTASDLSSKISKALDTVEADPGAEIGLRSGNPNPPTILGIFSGQGVQYAAMGAELIVQSQSARTCLDKLQLSLQSLPLADRPQWSLVDELLADPSSSRVGEATLSQPLCTAVQIMLVDVLHEAGIRLKAVVGHSSGEIGAAYAAGVLTSGDAIRIAYYRGLHSHLAIGKNGVKGAMMAVATTLEDAQEITALPEFEGRITVAAINSSMSVTISGDEDAVAGAKVVFVDERKKATVLNVDKAYHSYHMTHCSSVYIQSMETCNVKPKDPTDTCLWYSTVYNEKVSNSFPGMKGAYWNENLTRPVQFAPALKTALEQTSGLDAIIEVGSHPTLKGPASQTIQDVLSRNIPYASLLRRGTNSIDALASGMGFLWTHLGEHAVDFANFNRFMGGEMQTRLCKALPTYQWDHNSIHWQESRISRAIRTRKNPVHELLGSVCPNGNSTQVSWRNLLRVKEIPWIQGHALQNQTVFPAAGYVATAIEASKYLHFSGTPHMVEIQDFVIHQALIFDDDDAGIEILFSFVNITAEGDTAVSTLFTYHAATGTNSESDAMTLMASGRLRLLVATPTSIDLPPRVPREPNLIEVEADRFYNFMAEMGYGYTGPFRALSSLSRKLGKAAGFIANPKSDGMTEPLLVHPAMFDAIIQTVILAYCYPNDGRLWSLHLPVSIDRIRVDLRLCASIAGQGNLLPFDSVTRKSQRFGIFGDAQLYSGSNEQMVVQLEGVQAVPFTPATSADDSHVFSLMKWGLTDPSGEIAVGSNRASSEEYELAYTLERVAVFYLRSLDEKIPRNHQGRSEGAYVGLFNYAAHVCSQVAEGVHPYARKEWSTDTLDDILAASEPYSDSPDLKIMHIVGREMPRVIHGETTILEHLLPDNVLENYYSNALGFAQFTEWLSQMTAQIIHRYPRMKILEIGAGTGGATKGIFKKIGHGYSSYTFTDISNGFFENAREVFKDHAVTIRFKILDVEKDISTQGFEEHSYDLIIASHVLHATAKLEQTLRNVRRLLKPGGFILMAEGTNNDQIRGGFIFGALPGWWLGAADGRVLSPCVSPAQWDSVLRKTGFSGIDTITSDQDRFPYPGSVFASQAVDRQIDFLRRPLSVAYPEEFGRSVMDDLLIVGGASPKTMSLVKEVSEILKKFHRQIHSAETLEDVTPQDLVSSPFILSFTELDDPVFKDLTPERFEAIKSIFSQERTIMWITRGRRADVPESNMTYGFLRSHLWEVPDLRLQFLDFESSVFPSAHMISENFIRHSNLVSWEKTGHLENVLWSLEPELVFEEDQFLVPRLQHWEEANERLNSSRRQIAKQISTDDKSLGFRNTPIGRVLNQQELPPMLPSQRFSHLDVILEYSMSSAIRTSLGHSYLVAGRTLIEQRLVIALTDSLAAKIRVPITHVLSLPNAQRDISQIILILAHQLIVQSLLAKVDPGDSIWIHEPGELWSDIIDDACRRKGVWVSYTSSKAESEPPFVFMHAYATERDVRMVMPNDVSLFLDLSARGKETLGTRIASVLPNGCEAESEATLFTKEARKFSREAREVVHKMLSEAYDVALEYSNLHKRSPDIDVVGLANAYSTDKIDKRFAMIDWNISPTVALPLQPVDTNCLFSKDKTYWLVGLTGSLGLSLCEWMIQHGAKYVVMSSRNPKVDDRWLRHVNAHKAVVRIIRSDVTNRHSVREVYRAICDTLPPIAGVAQGAMVLHDTATRDMSFETLQKVLKPKVEGSKYLDELFPQNTLDFFIFFSSMAAVIGNIGQSNYTAANAFMCGLARQRRKRGLAGSVINIGVIIGVGYVTREVTHGDQKSLRKGGYMWMSESIFHQIFAEAVLAGRPGSGCEPEISTGLRRIDSAEANQPIWYNNPVFAKCILPKEMADAREVKASTGPPIRARLQAATNEAQVISILEDCFTLQLKSLLGGASDDEKTQKGMLSSQTDELGIDSLIAVEIRSWFLKNLEVNVPVLKILGGTTVRELLRFALKELPNELIPNAVINCVDTPSSTEVVVPLVSGIPQPVSPNLDAASGVSSSRNVPSDKSGSSSPAKSTPLSPLSKVTQHSDEIRLLSRPAIVKELPMSFSQSMFWFVTLYLPDKTTLNHFGYFRVHGRLRLHDMEMAVTLVAGKHESLRTCFFTNDEQQPIQGILETPILHLEHKWISDDLELLEECSRLKNHIYDLELGETMRLVVLSKSPDEHYLLIGCHHINVDGTSHQVLMSDLLKAYNHEPLTGKILQYTDFSVRQHEQHRIGAWATELTYWKKELRDLKTVLPLLSLSAVSSRRPLQEYAVHRVDARIPPRIASLIKATCRRSRVTPFHFYLTVFKVLLFRFSNAEEICIGMSDANRLEDGMLESIGPYVNLLPLRFRLQASKSFDEALQEAKDKTLNALANSALPFEVLLNELHIERSATHSPLFQSFIDYRQGARERMDFGESQIEMVEFEAGRTAYDLSLDIIDDAAGQPLLMFMAQSSLYSRVDTETLMQSYLHLAESFVEQPQVQCNQPQLYKVDDSNRALELGRDVYHESQWPATLAHRIKHISSDFGKKIAIKYATGSSMTYHEFWERSNSIAAALIDKGTAKGSVVANFQEPGLDCICSFLAILKVGAIYLPLDLGTPVMRLAIMAKDAQVSAILVHEATRSQVAALMVESAFTIDVSMLPVSSAIEVPVLANADSAAMILYTSGSTGAPKGIVLKHSSFVNEVEASVHTYRLGPDHVILQQSALNFDMSVLQIFLALSLGGTLVLLPRASRGDPVAITETISQEGVTYTCATPSEYTSWINYGNRRSLKSSAWKIALSGGEPVSQRLFQLFHSLRKSDLRLYNGYGPTETTCSSTKTEVDYSKSDTLIGPFSAGYPSQNESIYIVDDTMQPVPVGVVGEIVVGGAGVAIGYLHDEELTRKKFIPDCFATAGYKNKGWNTMYRTGDKGRWRADGSISVEGRITGDTQIKLRGLRIELGELEGAIVQASTGALTACAVSTRFEHLGDEEFLVAHVVFDKDFLQSQHNQLLASLPSALAFPQYMIPAAFIHLDQLPITSSGKVDRHSIAALPIARDLQVVSDSTAPTPLIARLKDTWKSVIPSPVFDRYDVGPGSDFFHVGGNSMLLVKLQARIRQTFQVSVPLVRLFSAPTLQEMALCVENTSQTRSNQSIDWDVETEPTQQVTALPQASPIDPVTPKIVVLTGATGFLGSHILSILSSNPQVSKIHCIAVRHSARRSSLLTTNKTILHEGDLTLPLLGLSENTAQLIFGEADVLIHNAADVSHLKTYHTLRLTNVDSTKELAKLCLKRMVPLHYVSTAGVATFTPRESFEEISVADTPPPNDGSDGYKATKWACERYLERMNETFGLPIYIHRPSGITRSSDLLGEDAAEMELLQNLLKYSRLLRATPTSDKFRGTLNLVSVESVAEGIVGMALQKRSPSHLKEQVTYVHQTGDFSLPIEGIKSFLEAETGEAFDMLGFGEWADRAEEIGLNVTVAAAFRNVEAMREPMIFPKFVKGVRK